LHSVTVKLGLVVIVNFRPYSQELVDFFRNPAA